MVVYMEQVVIRKCLLAGRTHGEVFIRGKYLSVGRTHREVFVRGRFLSPGRTHGKVFIKAKFVSVEELNGKSFSSGKTHEEVCFSGQQEVYFRRITHRKVFISRKNSLGTFTFESALKLGYQEENIISVPTHVDLSLTRTQRN